MLNIIHTNYIPLLKRDIHLKLKPLNELETVKIFAMPSMIRDKDIMAMFKGLLSLITEKSKQEQTEKYLLLQLKYSRLKYLYNQLLQTKYK